MTPESPKDPDKVVEMHHRFIRSSMIIAAVALIAGAYLVKKGDTLWDLSGVYLQSPFAWPDLWEKNKHVQDPHWIYPGDSLYIPNLDTMTTEPVAEVTPTLPEPSTALPDSLLPKGIATTSANGSRDDDFRKNLGNLPSKAKSGEGLSRKDSTLFIYRNRDVPPVFNKYYQMLAPRLVDISDFKKDQSWITILSGEKAQSLLLHTGDEILLRRTKGAKIQQGAIIELWLAETIQYPVQIKAKPVEKLLLRLAGFAKIESVGDTLSRAHITQTMGALTIAKAKAKLHNPPAIIQVKNYTEVAEVKYESMAKIRYAVDPSLAIGAYSYIIIDQGSSTGFIPGNAVAIWENEVVDPGLPPRLLGRGIVVSSESSESCVLVRELYSSTRRVANGNRVSITHQAVQK